MKNDFIYQSVTGRIIQQLEESIEFQKPWISLSVHGAPYNPVTKKYYKGINTLLLSHCGFSSNCWASFKQWKQKGASVKKGEKSTMIVFWKIFKKTSKNDVTGKKEEQNIPMLRYYNVFNADQVDGFDDEKTEIELPAIATRIDAACTFFDSIGIKINHGGDRAFYSPSSDEITMPNMDQFVGTKYSTATENYYSVLAHESTHATGHKSRLNREMSGFFGGESYAAEELVAELGAAYTMAFLGLSAEPRKDHAAYIQSWIKALKNNNKAIFTASSKAQKAVDWMIDRQTAEERKAA